MLLKKQQTLFHKILRQPIIRIRKVNILPPRYLDSGISGRWNSPVFFVNDFNSIRNSGIVIQNIPGTVCRAVIHQNEFIQTLKIISAVIHAVFLKLIYFLWQNTMNHLRQKRSCIINSCYNGQHNRVYSSCLQYKLAILILNDTCIQRLTGP